MSSGVPESQYRTPKGDLGPGVPYAVYKLINIISIPLLFKYI